MSKKVSEEIDLNCDAVPVDRENEDNDVNVGDLASLAGTSVRDFGEGNESAGGVGDLGKESKIESVKNPGIDLEADIGCLGEEVGEKVSIGLSTGGISLMEFDGGSRGSGDGGGISMDGKKRLETEQLAASSYGGVAEDLNVSDHPNQNSLIEGTSVWSSSIADDTVQSDSAHDSGSDDEKPLSSALGPENSLPCGDQNVCSKEESSGGLESHDMEIDTSDDTDKSRTITTRGEGERFFQNAENRFNLLNDVVDLNQSTSTDEDVALDVDAKPEKPEEPEFSVSDLVWGKVRSHPWWPGQIFDHSAATAKAKKYFKKDCYLIAYYGDQTFAWNDASRIKPFRSHFSRMEKQNNMEEFNYAVDCALDEVSRRVECGLACSCISEEAYAQVKTQITVNAGIREESSRTDGWDRFSSAAVFDPFELVETMKALAQSPYNEVDRLQLTTSKAQLLAFHRWKGYSQLPEFQNLCGLLESDTEIPVSEEVKKCSKLIGNDVPSVKVDKQMLSEKEKPESQDGSSPKQKKTPKVSCKKEKSLSELIAERRLSLQNGKRKLNNKAHDKLISSSPAKKLKAVDSVRDDSAVKHNKSNVSAGSVDKSLQSKQTFRVGASILRVASQLNGSKASTPVLKQGDGTPRRFAVNNKSKGKSSSDKSPGKKFFQRDISSPDEMLSHLRLAATNPLKGYNFLDSIVIFFTKLRNSIAMDLNSSEMSEQSLQQGTDVKTGEKLTRLKITGKFELTSIKDSCCSDRIIQCLPEEQLAVDKHNQPTEVSPKTPSEKVVSLTESPSAVQASPNSVNEQKQTITDENLGMEAEKLEAYSDESCPVDPSPTALILNFPDIDSVPSVEDLNNIFSRYGPLVEPGAEVFKKGIRAKVVFERRADAETAFSSSGTNSILGPALVSYRLKRLASTPAKASPDATKRSRTEETCGDGNAT